MTFSIKSNLTDREEEALKTLFFVGGSKEWVTAYSAASEARTQYDFTGPTLYRILSRLRGYVEYRTAGGIRKFHLLKAGTERINHSQSGSSFVKPGTPWSSQTELRTFLASHAKDYLLIVDPYISEDTLDIVASVKVPIRIVTVHIGRKNKEADFLRTFKKFAREKGRSIEIRRCAPSELHGRYIFTNGNGWVVDHSLQDLGTKPAIILPLNTTGVFKEVHSHFESIFLAGQLVQ